MPIVSWLMGALMAATYYCSADAMCSQNLGTPQDPWTIEECLNPANGATAGDTIEMAPGIYACEPCDLSHDGVTYEASGAVLEDTRSGAGAGLYQSVRVWCHDCTLRGATIRNASWSPTTETPTGISVFSNGVWLEKLEVYHVHNGVHTAYYSGIGQRTVVMESYIHDVGANNKGHGMYLQGPVVVEAARIEDAAHYGIQVWGTQPIYDVEIRNSMTRGSRLGGFVIGGGAPHENIVITGTAFVSRPPYSYEFVGVMALHDPGLTIRNSYLMGGLVLQEPGEPADVVLEGNLMHGGYRPGGPVQEPVWDIKTWDTDSYCSAGAYCHWVCTYPDNRWASRSEQCDCECTT